MNRRELLRGTLAVGAASWAASATQAAEASPSDEQLPLQIIDTNVSLFEWPFRRLPLDQTGRLVEKLRSLGVTQAWAGSFDGIFHRDLQRANERLAKECERFPELVPIGSVNPTLPHWERDVESCANRWKMPAIRLHPGYHGYTLEDPRFAELLEMAEEHGILIQIAVAVEDQRTQPTMLRVPDVDLLPLEALLRSRPKSRVQVLNANARQASQAQWINFPNLAFDVSRTDGTDAVPMLCKILGVERLLFGSHTPFLVPEAAMIRVHESELLSSEDLRQVYAKNAERWLRGVQS
ncbi:MAG: hypothetical protein KDA80_13380 [Planctomycetaceae bacterium]|nr:hypothetical protein [Planctomycetaceae bacterium]